MPRSTGHLQQLIEPGVTALGYELVGVEYTTQGRGSVLRVYIDSEQGISAEDCQRVSHQVSGVLDVEDPIRGAYTLEISSPGLDRPLFTAGHFLHFTGSRAKIRLRQPLEGRRNFSGILRGVQGEQVLIEDEGVEFSLPLANIDKARLTLEI